ncbi:DUF3806 domain-containing protein [Cellulomonas sp.]|uniref:DUF3806 domain-containing protein n=1 Tax=Cellulomonas sp. TaxID=40001 RepID=UPI00258866B3|nr:DUF3806 domain-containing protein [Cellulomonas sp.]MCR6688292.1 DUF3806 domain-containing protein [Cellulomonas sp.]
MEPARAARPTDGLVVPTPLPPGDDLRARRITALSAPEAVWAAQQRELVAGLCGQRIDEPRVSALFDRVHPTWCAATDPIDPQPLIHAFGVAMGDLVAAAVPGLSWASYQDRAGTELVLTHDVHDLVVFPVATVEAHWGTAGPGWFAQHLQTVVDGTRRLLATQQ